MKKIPENLMNGFDLRPTFRREVNLLVIDDEEDHREQIKEYASMYNPLYKVECKIVGSGNEALEIIKSFRPTVVLLDIHLPDINSFEMLQQLIDAGTPVVVMSREQIPDMESTLLEKGAIAYVPKSEDPDDVEGLMELLASVSGVDEVTH